MRRAAGALSLAAVATLVLAAPSWGTEVSREQLAELARSASSGDAAALAALDDVSSVEGQAFDSGAVIGGTSGGELEGRLAQLERAALEPAVQGSDATQARAAAERILGGDVPPPVEETEEDDDSPGSIGVPLPAALAIALAALAVGAVAARTAARRSLPAEVGAPGTVKAPGGPERPEQLEREAADAERRGDFAAAIRLRFRAGLLRLDSLGALRLRPSLTAEMALRESRAGKLEPLAGSYQRIVFGGKEADRGDAERQRLGWEAVIDQVRSR